jgi:hypothetical protein
VVRTAAGRRVWKHWHEFLRDLVWREKRFEALARTVRDDVRARSICRSSR